MLFGARNPDRQPLDVGELRKLVVQLDAADVPDGAILRGTTRMGGRLSQITVDSRERIKGPVPERTRAEERGPGWNDPKRPS